MLNLSPLFFTTVDDESCMHGELDLTPEQRIKDLEVQLKQSQQKAQLFEAVIDVLRRDYGVRIVKKPLGKSCKSDSSKD